MLFWEPFLADDGLDRGEGEEEDELVAGRVGVEEVLAGVVACLLN